MLDNQVLDEGMEILEKKFRVIKRLGSGSFGEIYKLQKIKNGEYYAAKIVSDRVLTIL